MSTEEIGGFPFGAGKQLYLLTDEALAAFADRVATQTVAEYERRIKVAENEPFVSMKEACEMLKVCRATLWKWEQRGYLKAYHIGQKTLYKRSDIDALYNKK
jgi:excisionase family DNA binding protein